MNLEVLSSAGTTFAALIPLANPLNAIPMFTAMTGELTDEERTKQATKAGLYTGAILLVTALAGSFILEFFAINLGMLQVAGGLIVGGAAWAMSTGNPQASKTETATWAKEKRFSLRKVPKLVAKTVETHDVSTLKRAMRRKPPKPAPEAEAVTDTEAVQSEAVQAESPAEQQPTPARAPGPAAPVNPSPDDISPVAAERAAEPERVRDVAFSPIAMPLLAGPAAMGMVIGLTSQSSTFSADLGILLGIGLMTLLAVYGLRASNAVLHAVGASGILAFQRIFGFILLAIAVALVAGGISELFGIPIYTD